ncbi:MAG: hypothetical protein RLZZ63_167 [Gemmatimonadota bacterium]
MEMADGLSSVGPRIDDAAIPGRRDPLCSCHLLRQAEHPAQGARVRRGLEGFEMLTRDDEDVHRSLGGDVTDGEGVVRLGNGHGGNLTGADTAEETGGLR